MEPGDLKLDDMEFMTAVLRINSNPDNYADTDISEKPANSKVIRINTELNSEQVNYRMGGRSAGRGLEDDGLIESFNPIMNHGPRSVILTKKGKEILSEAKNRTKQVSGVDRDEFVELSNQVSGMWEDVTDNRRRLNQIHRYLYEITAADPQDIIPYNTPHPAEQNNFVIDQDDLDKFGHQIIQTLHNRYNRYDEDN